jgi:hypothetical protein
MPMMLHRLRVVPECWYPHTSIIPHGVNLEYHSKDPRFLEIENFVIKYIMSVSDLYAGVEVKFMVPCILI